MDIDSGPAQPSGYTILRIKRKRTDEPLDALVVEPSKKRKSKGGIGVFQFAETVEEAAWRDEQQADSLRTRISTLAQKVPRDTTNQQISQTPPIVSTPQATSLDPAASRRYTVIKQDGAELEAASNSRHLRAPPKVLSSKDLAAAASNFTVYDAILASDNLQDPVDPEMEKFQNLLQDYLQVNDITPEPNPAIPLRAPGRHASVPRNTFPSASSANDYVWDVFFHKPSTLPGWVQATNVATLTGLPPSLNDPFDSDSDSEFEDEEDEDSNAEDFYKNDYPDEEDAEDSDSSDMFHDGSEGESDDPQDRFVPSEWR